MNNYFENEMAKLIENAKDSIHSFFNYELFLSLILVSAALVIVFGTARLLEKEQSEEEVE